MSELNEGGSFAAASSGKSPEEIAFELVNKLKGQGVWGERNMADILDMYAECLDAAKGHRTYAGQKRVDLPVQRPGAAAAPAQAAPAHQAAAQPAARPPVTAQPAQTQPLQAQPQMQAAPQQPVQAQQQALQQAFRQG